MFEHLTPTNNSPQVPYTPRVVLGATIWPWPVTHGLTPQEIRDERFLHQLEIKATQPQASAMMLALVSVLSMPGRPQS